MIRFERKRLENLRASLGLSTSEFARKLPRSTRQSVDQWERGDCCPTIPSLLDICNTYDVDPMYFFVNTDVRMQQERSSV